MPSTDNTWRLVYPGVDIALNDGDPYFITGLPELGQVDPEVQDASYPGGDGTQFGRDTTPGPTLTLELGVNEYGTVTGLDAHGRLARAWRGDSIRSKPGAVAELSVTVGGRTRATYGRPRRFASVLHQTNSAGWSGATADFQRVNDVWYDAQVQTVTVSLVPTPAGGFVSPFVFPLTSTAAAERGGLIQTEGNLDTWPVVAVHGPVTNPSVELVGVGKFTVNASLAWDQTVTIDTRPWSRTVRRNDGAAMAGKLPRTSLRLSEAKLPPETLIPIVYRGTDATGTSSASVSWQDAYSHF